MTTEKSSNTAENRKKSAETTAAEEKSKETRKTSPRAKPAAKAPVKTPKTAKTSKPKTPAKPDKKKKVPGKPFVKGDPRINRHGRPVTFDTWRKLNQSILNEIALDGLNQPIKIKSLQIKDGMPVRDKNGRLVIDEHYATNAEMIIRAKVHNIRYSQDVALAAFGKPPDDINMNIDMSSLSTKQLARLARGESLMSVLGNPDKP